MLQEMVPLLNPEVNFVTYTYVVSDSLADSVTRSRDIVRVPPDISASRFSPPLSPNGRRLQLHSHVDVSLRSDCRLYGKVHDL